MTIEIVAGSLVELLAAISFSGYSLSLFFIIFLYREFHTQRKCAGLHDFAGYVRGEQRALVSLAWLLTNVIVAALLSIFFAEAYEAEDDADSAPVILALLMLVQVLMMFWLLTQSIWCETPTRWPFAWLLAVFIIVIVETALVFTTLHESHWYHYLLLTLFVPPMVAAFASNGVFVYRSTVSSSSSRKEIRRSPSSSYQYSTTNAGHSEEEEDESESTTGGLAFHR